MAGFFLTLLTRDKAWQLKTKALQPFSPARGPLLTDLLNKFKAGSGLVYTSVVGQSAVRSFPKLTNPKLGKEDPSET